MNCDIALSLPFVEGPSEIGITQSLMQRMPAGPVQP